MTEIFLYCDGAVQGNGGPGRIGMGVVLWCPSLQLEREYSWGESLERATNIIAELEAIKGGLLRVKPELRRQVGITIVTDSEWSIRALSGEFYRTKHDARLRVIQALLEEFAAYTFRHVRGHSGHIQNERCDALASAAARPSLP